MINAFVTTISSYIHTVLVLMQIPMDESVKLQSTRGKVELSKSSLHPGSKLEEQRKHLMQKTMNKKKQEFDNYCISHSKANSSMPSLQSQNYLYPGIINDILIYHLQYATFEK